MHEYKLAKQIIQTAEEFAVGQGATDISKINLVVGEYSGCIAESIQLYFDLMAEDTMCKNAELSIEKIKPMLKCKSCDNLFERKPFDFKCTFTNCIGEGEPTSIGREFYIKSIEIRL